MTTKPTHFKYQCRICSKELLQAIVVNAPSETPIPRCCGRRSDMAYKGVHVQVDANQTGTGTADGEQFTFEPDSKAIWTSTAAASAGAVEVLILGPTDESAYDRHDVGQMYDNRLPDGSDDCAFEDELAPSPLGVQVPEELINAD
ncbi:hypothetical protein H8F21_14205 [Pseudomonas sp. P66]|uniref:Uncharacterized protein n=1 Tax=Pseudomonas arcuscaelestis TaxID=2710591 RepID=A0ABS2BYL3_9PSED|nr:hypothetical protein [Pseudomonas arcuscaelestis]MBM5458717.1 hypothetical protein [Pseudomonas arcuscaelestis]